MRFGFLILAAGLLAGCGNNFSERGALDECRDALDISMALSPSAPSLDGTTLVNLAKDKCEGVLADNKLFKILALEKREKIFKVHEELKIKKTTVQEADKGLPKMLTGEVYQKNSEGIFKFFTTYSIYIGDITLDYEVFEWVLIPDVGEMKGVIEFYSK